MRLGSPLTIGFLIGLLGLAAFAYLAHCVVRESGLVTLDPEVSQTLRGHAQEHPDAANAFRVITDLGGPVALLGGAVLVVLVLVKKRQYLLALVWIIAVIGGFVLNDGLKHVFQRQRPSLGVSGFAFPSGHSMNSLAFYGLLAYLLMLAFPQRWLRWLIAIGLGLLVLAIGFSRIYLGAHWMTDVLGGFSEATVWLALWITAIETVRRRHIPRLENP